MRDRRAAGTYDGAIEATTQPILELGVLLLVAALAGWTARRLRLPAASAWLLPQALRPLRSEHGSTVLVRLVGGSRTGANRTPPLAPSPV